MPSNDPLTIIGEILGQPAEQMRNPVNAEYRCPFLASTCTKRSHSGMRGDTPYPVCSIWRQGRILCVCPKRFYEIEIVKDVIEHCWVKPSAPVNVRRAHEVQMKGFGCVDIVIAELTPNGTIQDFISVELQAVDMTGSVYLAFEAITNNIHLEKRPSHGVNWANVRKRYIEQLIKKGIFHHHWGSRIVSVIQSALYEKFRESIQFDELDPKSENSHIVFMIYDFVLVLDNEGISKHTLKFSKAVGTSHNSLMMSALYRTPPDREVFCSKIIERF